MPYEQSIALFDDEAVLAEYGPMRLVIRAWRNERPQVEPARRAAEKSFTYLERVAGYRQELSRSFPKIAAPPQDALAIEMVNSVAAVGDDDLTPMAAVAGTIADAVADWLFERGMTKVIVDNGGDISIRLSSDATATVGIRPAVTSAQISHLIRLDAGRPTWGVTTSGFGGRSFSRGIASAVTVLASNASVADAAATAIANACFVEDDGITRMPAGQIEPDSDIAGIHVTTEVGSLGPEKILTAIETARKKARYLFRRGVIIGAFIALQNVFAVTDSMRHYILPMSENDVAHG